MLSDEEKKEIRAEQEMFPTNQAASIGAMLVLQKHRGWISDDTLADLADFLQLTVDELDSVATFYDKIFRKPVGDHIIRVCDSVSCWIMGYESLRDQLYQQLQIKFGETTPDHKFTLLPNVCLGDCDHAPVMMIDDRLYRNVTPEELVQILSDY
ncbi:MAG: NADH-quinone oxidoreductase subunit NuoE [Chloroflexi bacterium]|nr:NADH-quinone oxidoreductase subunit NuoE [Chloroflexota bacterium]